MYIEYNLQLEQKHSYHMKQVDRNFRGFFFFFFSLLITVDVRTNLHTSQLIPRGPRTDDH